MPNVPEVIDLTAEQAALSAAEAIAAATAAIEESEKAENARAVAEAEAASATEAAQSAEEGGYPAGKEAAEVVVEPATEPVAGAQKSVTLGEPGVVHSVKVVFVGDASKTKWKVEHKLKTKSVSAVFHTDETGPGIQTLVSLVKVISEEEIEVTLTKAPGAGTPFWLIVQG